MKKHNETCLVQWLNSQKKDKPIKITVYKNKTDVKGSKND